MDVYWEPFTGHFLVLVTRDARVSNPRLCPSHRELVHNVLVALSLTCVQLMLAKVALSGTALLESQAWEGHRRQLTPPRSERREQVPGEACGSCPARMPGQQVGKPESETCGRSLLRSRPLPKQGPQGALIGRTGRRQVLGTCCVWEVGTAAVWVSG